MARQIIDDTMQRSSPEPLLASFIQEEIGMKLLSAPLPRVLSIIGPQSSGKSTLANELFDTSFVTLPRCSVPKRTTRGIWISRARGPQLTPERLVLDLQGSDSIESGESARAFERRSALFALAMSETMIINIHFKVRALGCRLPEPIPHPWHDHQMEGRVSLFSTGRRAPRGLTAQSPAADLLGPPRAVHARRKHNVSLVACCRTQAAALRDSGL
jgi:hypothetical protein